MQNYIVCCGTNGQAVVFGQSESEPVPGEPITLHNAKMVLFWPAECGGLFGLCAKGPKKGLRLTHAVDCTATEVVRQWLTVSDESAAALREWPAA
jgi:hypothetical protein